LKSPVIDLFDLVKKHFQRKVQLHFVAHTASWHAVVLGVSKGTIYSIDAVIDICFGIDSLTVGFPLKRRITTVIAILFSKFCELVIC